MNVGRLQGFEVSLSGKFKKKKKVFLTLSFAPYELCPSSSPLQGKIIAQGRLLLQDTFMVSDPEGGHLGRMKERRVFLFEQLVIFSEPLEKKKGFSLPGFLYKNSIKVNKHGQKQYWFNGLQLPLVDKFKYGPNLLENTLF